MDDSREITIREPSASALAVERAPDAVLEEAARAAKALRSVLLQKPNKVMMGGEQYLEFDDWQTLGRFYGVTAREDGDPEYVEFGASRGFKASAVALTREGQEISRATAYCLTDEEKWGGRPKYVWGYVCKDGSWSAEDPGPEQIVWEPNPERPGKSRPKKERRQVGAEAVPLFQMASMAQTRACAKALRNVLSWVAVLAGYKPTPAEELDGQTSTEPTPANAPRPGTVAADLMQRQTAREAPGKRNDQATPPPPGATTDEQRSAIRAMFDRLGREVSIPERFEDAARLISELNEEINRGKGDVIEGEAREIPADAQSEAIPFDEGEREGSKAPPATPAPNGGAFVCASCGEPLTETRFRDGTVWTPAQLAAYGRRKHGRVLCMTDYKAANDAVKASAT